MKKIYNVLKNFTKTAWALVFASFILNFMNIQVMIAGVQGPAVPTAVVPAVDSNVIRYGDKVQFKNSASNMYLTGGSISNGGCRIGGFKEIRLVFEAPENGEDATWIVKGEHKDGDKWNCRFGEIVKKGSKIRLENSLTHCNLHARIPSLSYGSFGRLINQEKVILNGSNGIGNDNDNWNLLELGDEHNGLCHGTKIKFIHLKTHLVLHPNGNFINERKKRQEVTLSSHRDNDDDWFILERVESYKNIGKKSVDEISEARALSDIRKKRELASKK